MEQKCSRHWNQFFSSQCRCQEIYGQSYAVLLTGTHFKTSFKKEKTYVTLQNQ